MPSPDDRLAYALERVKQLAADSRDPQCALKHAEQIFEDTFTKEPLEQPVMSSQREGVRLPGHARRETVPELMPPPTEESKPDVHHEYHRALSKRADVVGNNERKLRALLWARAVFLQAGDERAQTLESAIREWWLCSLPELPTESDGIEQCVKANARASWATLERVRAERWGKSRA